MYKCCALLENQGLDDCFLVFNEKLTVISNLTPRAREDPQGNLDHH